MSAKQAKRKRAKLKRHDAFLKEYARKVVLEESLRRLENGSKKTK